MKLKLTLYTDVEGDKYYITSFEYSGTGGHYRTKVISAEGHVVSGPRVLIENMPEQPKSRCQTIEAELVIPVLSD